MSDAVKTVGLMVRGKAAFDPEEVEDRVFLHRGAARERLSRFTVLMFLATAIATFGIATDSTAVVIGAMLVAPLMTPILGTAAGLINGRTRSAGISAAVVVLGATFAVFVAWLLSALVPDLEAVIQNSQVTTRTSPSLLDLAIDQGFPVLENFGLQLEELEEESFNLRFQQATGQLESTAAIRAARRNAARVKTILNEKAAAAAAEA